MNAAAPSLTAKRADKRGQLSRWLGANRIDHIRSALTTAGVCFNGPHTGKLPVGGRVVDVRLEPDDVICFGCDAASDSAPQTLLERCATAPGNLRFSAAESSELRLQADTRINGVAHLPQTIAEIGAGMEAAMSGQPAVVATPGTFPFDPVLQALATAGWPTSDAVERTDGFELSATCNGERVTVVVCAVADAILVQRTILPTLPSGDAGWAVCHQALACNAQLRACRLAVSHGRLSVEARLNSQQINADWLSSTIRAVAGVAHSIEPRIDLLAREQRVAAEYVEMFLAPGRSPTGSSVAHAASMPGSVIESPKLAASAGEKGADVWSPPHD